MMESAAIAETRKLSKVVAAPNATPPREPRGGVRVEALDGLRAIAVLGVVALHTGMLSWGWAGVDLFFALSGFLITGILLDAKEAGGHGWATYGRPFYARRALRILPLAYSAMIVVFILGPAARILRRTPAGEQLWYWLYVSNWWVWPRSLSAWHLSHFWSLAVEEQFYVCWPWMVLALSRRRIGYMAAGLLITAPILRLVIAVSSLPPQVGHTYEEFSLTRLDGLAAGAIVAVLSRDKGLADWRRLIDFALVAGVLFSVAAIGLAAEAPSFVLRYTAVGFAAAAAVAWAIANPDALAVRLLRFKPLRWIGTTSYCIYVVHPAVVGVLRGRGGVEGPRLFIGTVAATMCLAAASWYAFEQPILSLKRRFPMPRRVHMLSPDAPYLAPVVLSKTQATHTADTLLAR